jgi:[protein-PII] uridylyltransferase
MTLERAPLLADETLRGAAWCRAHSDLVDAWLRTLLSDHAGIALVAVGGYGRAELAPQSDIDVMLVHDRRRDIGAVADRIWYPVWDAGLKLGHSVVTVKQALELAADDLDTATALLSARHVAGDPAPARRLAEAGRRQWEKKSKRWLALLAARVRERHATAGEVAFSLEPDLKEGRGGLRDVHSLHWAQAARPVLLDHDAAVLAGAYEVLLDARVELQRTSARPTNALSAGEQGAVARALGDADEGALLRRIASAARMVAWTSDDTWRRVEGRAQTVGFDGGVDPFCALRTAAAAARQGAVIERQSLERLAAEAPALPDPWPVGARDLLVELLLAGRAAVPVVEALELRGVWARLLPVRDRRVMAAVVHAADVAGRVDRPDLLVVAALLHGLADAHGWASRMGFGPDDAAAVGAVADLHGLLEEVAARRDLDDPATIERVAAAVGSRERLAMLAALAGADTPAVGELVSRVGHVLGGGDVAGVVGRSFPTKAQLLRLAGGEQVVEADDGVVTVMTDDRPGLFSKVAGVLALHGLDVLAAAAYSSEDGRALNEFRVSDPFRAETPWAKVTADLERALAGRLAVQARVTERARVYGRHRAVPAPATVVFDTESSADATIIDVHATDRVGVLFAITRALAELDLDIRSAKVQTLGPHVVDAFYVRGRDGAKMVDPAGLAEVERAILHSLGH